MQDLITIVSSLEKQYSKNPVAIYEDAIGYFTRPPTQVFAPGRLFVTITNLNTGKYDVTYNLSKNLGLYFKSDISVEDFYKRVKGYQKIILKHYGLQMYVLLSQSSIAEQIFRDTSYFVEFEIQHTDGHWVKVLRQSKMLKSKVNNKLMANINYYYIVDTVGPAITAPTISCRNQNAADKIEQKLIKSSKNKVIQDCVKLFGCNNNKLFTPSLMKVVQLRAKGLTSAQIAKKLPIEQESVKIYSRRILKLINLYFECNFKNCNEACIFLKKSRFI